MPEFELIRQIRKATTASVTKRKPGGVRLGIGDDAAVVAVPDGHDLVATTDTLNSGVHFPEDTQPCDLGYKCLAVNLSDLAAMGATPRWVLLSLSMPAEDPAWLRSFTAGFVTLAHEHGVVLVGGDTTRGPLSVCLTALGVVEPGRQMQRDGALPGDLVVVSGTIGGAARVLDLLNNGASGISRALLDRPEPRVALGRSLAGHAHACIDVSDGLLADLTHLLKASGCGARIELGSLPAAELLSGLDDETRWLYQLSGGDDYELLFTISPAQAERIRSLQAQLDIRLSVIGEITQGEGVICLRPGGAEFHPPTAGFEHFGPGV